MKRNRKSLILLSVLLIVAAFLLINNRSADFRKKDNVFAVSDTSSITRFFLADKNNNTVKISRLAGNKWILNDKYDVNPSMVEVMLNTFCSIDVKAPVAKSTRNTIIRLLAARSVKTEIYQKVYRINIFGLIRLFPHEKLTRTYYVGDVTRDNRGTFMLMEGAEDPYVVGIPGFRGFVTSRYSALEGDWRSHAVFSSRVPDIRSVSVVFNEAPAKSFRITNLNTKSFTLESLIDGSNIEKFDTTNVVRFLSMFRSMNFESILDEMPRRKFDSIVSTVPTNEITLTDRFGKQHILKTWKRKADFDQVDLLGNPTEWDVERMYGLVGNSEYMVSLQYFVFNDVLVPLQFFIPENKDFNNKQN